jgi:hypothetical protein
MRPRPGPQRSTPPNDYHRLRRRFGYVVRHARDPLGECLERAGVRLVPLNRLRPSEGHRYAACPACGASAGLFIEPGSTWGSTCGCAPSSGLDRIDLEFFLRGAA